MIHLSLTIKNTIYIKSIIIIFHRDLSNQEWYKSHNVEGLTSSHVLYVAYILILNEKQPQSHWSLIVMLLSRWNSSLCLRIFTKYLSILSNSLICPKGGRLTQFNRNIKLRFYVLCKPHTSECSFILLTCEHFHWLKEEINPQFL